MTLEEVAILLRRSPDAVRQMKNRGQLPPEAVLRRKDQKRGKLLFDRVAIERYLQSLAGGVEG
jgi:hypothetical protein